jgi:hypothetical protein
MEFYYSILTVEVDKYADEWANLSLGILESSTESYKQCKYWELLFHKQHKADFVESEILQRYLSCKQVLFIKILTMSTFF